MNHRHRQSVRRILSPLPLLVLLATGCGASVHSGKASPSSMGGIDYRHAIASAVHSQSDALALRADRKSYQPGQAITLSLVNDSAVSYGSDASCTTPTAVWLRGNDGATYFVNSGASTTCSREAAIAPGQSAAIAVVDRDMVWVDHSSDEKLFRLPNSLPIGKYTVHALTSRGELVTSLAIR